MLSVDSRIINLKYYELRTYMIITYSLPFTVAIGVWGPSRAGVD